MSARLWWSSSCGRLELQLTEEQARSASHQGQCDEDVAALARVPEVAAQLAAFDPEHLRAELRGYGAWDDAELADHEQNLQRILWLAAGDIVENSAEHRPPSSDRARCPDCGVPTIPDAEHLDADAMRCDACTSRGEP